MLNPSIILSKEIGTKLKVTESNTKESTHKGLGVERRRMYGRVKR